MIDLNTVRTVLTAAESRGWGLHEMDVKTAFLHGNIDSDVCVTPPSGVKLCKDTAILKLTRGLYGLKQALCL